MKLICFQMIVVLFYHVNIFIWFPTVKTPKRLCEFFSRQSQDKTQQTNSCLSLRGKASDYSGWLMKFIMSCEHFYRGAPGLSFKKWTPPSFLLCVCFSSHLMMTLLVCTLRCLRQRGWTHTYFSQSWTPTKVCMCFHSVARQTTQNTLQYVLFSNMRAAVAQWVALVAFAPRNVCVSPKIFVGNLLEGQN